MKFSIRLYKDILRKVSNYNDKIQNKIYKLNKNIVGVDLRVDPIQNKIILNNHRINDNGLTQGAAPTNLSFEF